MILSLAVHIERAASGKIEGFAGGEAGIVFGETCRPAAAHVGPAVIAALVFGDGRDIDRGVDPDSGRGAFAPGTSEIICDIRCLALYVAAVHHIAILARHRGHGQIASLAALLESHSVIIDIAFAADIVSAAADDSTVKVEAAVSVIGDVGILIAPDADITGYGLV